MIHPHGHQNHAPASFIPSRGEQARLHLDGQEVGTIEVTGWDSSWTYGRFQPGEAFGNFATIFGRWSLLMHEDEDRPLHEINQAALADAERQMDSLHAKVYFPAKDLWREVWQLNIDGELVEWKDF